MNNDRVKELVDTVEQRYKFKVDDIVFYRGCLLVKTFDAENKYFILKKIECDEKRVDFTYEVQKHIRKNGFSNCEMYVPYEHENIIETDEGEDGGENIDSNFGDAQEESQTENEERLMFCERESNWILSEYIEGRESNFDDEEELMKICRSLAKMHSASRGFSCGEEDLLGTGNINRLGKLPMLFSKRLSELERLKKKSLKERKEFDIEYLNNVTAFLEWGKAALEYIDTPTYALLVQNAALEGGISHCDLTYQNILVDEGNGNVFFTGFECACFELYVYDLANLIRRKMRKCEWDFDVAVKMVEEYNSVRSLSEAEVNTMKGILLFPQKFWRIANSYYNMNKAWTHRNMKDKLLDAIAEKDAFARFAQSLRFSL